MDYKSLQEYKENVGLLHKFNSENYFSCLQKEHYHIVLNEMLRCEPEVMYMINPELVFEDLSIDKTLQGRLHHLSEHHITRFCVLTHSDNITQELFREMDIMYMDAVLAQKPETANNSFISDGIQQTICKIGDKRVASFNQPKYAERISDLYFIRKIQAEELCKRVV